MRKGKKVFKSFLTAGLSLSFFLSSFGNVTEAHAQEISQGEETLVIESAKQSEEGAGTSSSESYSENVVVENEETQEKTEDENTGENASEYDFTDSDQDAETVDVEYDATAEDAEDGDSITATGYDTAEVKVSALTSNAAPRDQKEADNSLITKEYIHDGAILHAFCWSFNTIAENMADIADAGYTAVQTSPINECLDTDSGMNLHGPDGMWYYHYQPTDWVIGNYQLGTRDEFKNMCEIADEYGVAIIVDILPNHTTPSIENVSEALKEAVGGEDYLYHTTGRTAGGYTDRLELTYYEMGGLPDVDTENISFQEYFFEFLKDCVYLGADGFRMDTAKHIALPDDPVPSDYEDADRNNFYPNMQEALNEYADEVGTKGYDDLFVYGEVLQGTGDRLASYQEYIGGTTASNYGSSLRSALSAGDLSVSRISDYQIYDDTVGDRTYEADTEKLVTWVESHDTYMNDGNDSWKIDDDQLLLGWAFITARKDGTPLFFSRPNNSSKDNPFGDNLIGAAGSDIYKAPEVKAVNLFRQEMGDAEEILTNPGGNTQTVMIEREDEAKEGAVIINAGSTRTTINTETVLDDGAYPNQVEGADEIFLVKDGILSGSVDSESVVVLSERIDTNGTIVSFYNSENWDSVVARVDGAEETLGTIDDGDGWYWLTVLDDEFTIVFESEDGNSISPVYEITQTSGTYATVKDSTLYSSKKEAEEGLGIYTYSVYFFNTEGWDSVYAYGWLYGGEQLFGGWPGTVITNEGSGWWRADTKVKGEISDFSIIFNNGNGIQTANIEGITPDSTDVYCAVSPDNTSSQLSVKRYSDKASAENELGVSGSFTTAYFYNTEGWEKVCVYTWGATSFGDWPGMELTAEEDGWYKVVLPAGAGDDLNIIFNNGNNGKQTSDMKISDMKYRYILHNGLTYQKYSSKKEALEAIGENEDITYTTVYFYNEYADDDSWQNVGLYVYGGSDGEYNNLIGNWPGKTMTREEDSNWYTAEVPTKAIDTGTVTYIFNNNNNGQQLSDNRNITSDRNYFTSSSTDSFASKEEVYEYLGYNPKEDDEIKGEFVVKWGTTYFITEDGEKLTGLYTVQEDAYYFKSNGAMVKKDYVTIDGSTYYFDGEGKMVRGFMKKWGSTYYFDENGVQVKDKLTVIEADTYYFKKSGQMVYKDFVTFEDGKRYFDAEGKMVYSATITRWGKKYTFDENGLVVE